VTRRLEEWLFPTEPGLQADSFSFACGSRPRRRGSRPTRSRLARYFKYVRHLTVFTDILKSLPGRR
jgi:hypothetical protein